MHNPINSDRIATQYRNHLPKHLTQAIGTITLIRLLGYAVICYPSLIPLLWLPGMVAIIVSLITGVKIWDNNRRGEVAIGNSEASDLIALVILFTIPLVATNLENRLATKPTHETASTRTN